MKTYKAELPELEFKYKTKENVFKSQIKSSRDSEEVFRKLFDADVIEYREEFILLLMNQANKTIGFIKISSGGVSGTVVDAKLIFAAALKSGASSFLMAHNHPSGNLRPSEQDINLTRKIKEGAKLLDLSCLDHLILTNESYFSFADEGML